MPSDAVPWARVTVEMPERWVRVSTELLAELGEWSEPLRVKVVSDTDGVLDMIFQRVEVRDA